MFGNNNNNSNSSKYFPKSDYDWSAYDGPGTHVMEKKRSEQSIKIDAEMYVILSRWKSRLRDLYPGHPITLRAIFNRGIYLVCKELEAKYGAPE